MIISMMHTQELIKIISIRLRFFHIIINLQIIWIIEITEILKAVSSNQNHSNQKHPSSWKIKRIKREAITTWFVALWFDFNQDCMTNTVLYGILYTVNYIPYLSYSLGWGQTNIFQTIISFWRNLTESVEFAVSRY